MDVIQCVGRMEMHAPFLVSASTGSCCNEWHFANNRHPTRNDNILLQTLHFDSVHGVQCLRMPTYMIKADIVVKPRKSLSLLIFLEYSIFFHLLSAHAVVSLGQRRG